MYPNEQLWIELAGVESDDTAARAGLAAGHPIYYVEIDTPDGLQNEEIPDGRRELVRFYCEGDEIVCTL